MNASPKQGPNNSVYRKKTTPPGISPYVRTSKDKPPQYNNSGNMKELSKMNAAGMILDIVDSVKNNKTDYMINVYVQKKGESERAVIEFQVSSNPMGQYAGSGYYHLDASNLNEGIRYLIVDGLEKKLSKMGYKDYVKNNEYTNIYIQVDEKHANDATYGYISRNTGGALLITPKLYKNDKMWIVDNKPLIPFFNIGGLSNGHEKRYDLSQDLRAPVALNKDTEELVFQTIQKKVKKLNP